MNEVSGCRIKVIGVGGAGCNVLRHIMEGGVEEVEYHMIADEVPQILRHGTIVQKLLLGRNTRPQPFCRLTPGWGRRFALDDEPAIRRALHGGDLLLLVAGMGGGLGTGAMPVVVRIGKEMGALTVTVLSSPFPFEGDKRRILAERGTEEIKDIADMTILIPYDRIISMVSPHTALLDAYRMPDKIFCDAVKGLIEIMRRGHECLLDNKLDSKYETLKSFLAGSGQARMGLGTTDRLTEAMQQALSCPLLENVLGRARKVIAFLAASDETMLSEIDACNDLLLQNRLRQDVQIVLVVGKSHNRPMVALYATSLN